MNDREFPDPQRTRRIREEVFRTVQGRTLFAESHGIGEGRLQSSTVYPRADVRDALYGLEAEGLLQREALPEGGSYWRLSDQLLRKLRRRRLLQALAEAVGRPMTTETRSDDA